MSIEVELDAGGIGVGGQVTTIFRKHGHDILVVDG
jgi:hypothetical protein